MSLILAKYKKKVCSRAKMITVYRWFTVEASFANPKSFCYFLLTKSKIKYSLKEKEIKNIDYNELLINIKKIFRK